MSKKTETLEEFLARGGKVTKAPLVDDLKEIKKYKQRHLGDEMVTSGIKGKSSFKVTKMKCGSSSLVQRIKDFK